MSDPELAEIAAAVGKALGLKKVQRGDDVYWVDDGDFGAVLEADTGDYGFTDPYWFKRCVLWLTEHHHQLLLRGGKGDEQLLDLRGTGHYIDVVCSVDEAPARLIHALQKAKP